MRGHGRTLILCMLACGFLLVPLSSQQVSAAGNLYITPAATPVLPVGSSFSVLVKVASMDQFNGWEIQVVTDPSVVTPTSVSTAGNIFQANATGGLSFETRNCVNGAGSGCCLTNACSPVDGTGVADSSYADTKLVSGNGLLFTVTFKVVGNKPYGQISIQNDVLSNGGANGVVHSTTSAQYGSLSSIAITSFFTTGDLIPLPLDKNGTPSVNVTFLKGLVRGTDPHSVLAWANVTDSGSMQLQSLVLNETLPVDWTIHPSWLPSKGGVHVYYANTTSLNTNPEITEPATVTVTTANPQRVNLAIANFSSTGIGHALLPGQSILVSVMLNYGLVGTPQPMTSYPRNYTDTSTASAYIQPSFNGGTASASGSAFFIAHAKQLGDFRGDDNVDIRDVGLVLSAFGSSLGSPNWFPAADFNNDGSVGLDDVQLILSNFGAGSAGAHNQT